MSNRMFDRCIAMMVVVLLCCAGVMATAAAQTVAAAQPRLQMPQRTRMRVMRPVRIPPVRIVAKIPTAPSMQVFRLKPSRVPTRFLNGKLKAARLPGLKRDAKSRDYVLRVPDRGDREGGLRAFIDARSGDMEFIPNMGELVRTAEKVKPMSTERDAVAAKAIYADRQFIPRDATTLRVADPIRVVGGEAGKPEPGGVTKGRSTLQVMTLVPVVRYADGHPVYGVGSHAVVTFDDSGKMVGAMRRWRTALPGERIKPRISPNEVRREIVNQLRPLVSGQHVTAVVDKVELAYYDNNRNFLQPVYHFEATVQTIDKVISPIRISGFVPYGQPREPIPNLAAKPKGDMPLRPRVPNITLPRGGVGAPPTPNDITLGEYANQDWPNDSGYVSMANHFYDGLRYLNVHFGVTPPVTRTQWYVAYPWEVVGPWSKYYMNAVNVAYTVPHGDWLINTTRKNCCDVWRVNDIGTGGNPGYGAAAGGGKLATWVIMSCEVIPSYYDRLHEEGGSGNGYDAFNAWWPVFQGMHNAIGFRTIMYYPDNSLQWGFGYAASLGGDVNAAWFQEVAAHEAGRDRYHSQHLAGSPLVHYDRASTMVDGRDLGQSIYAVGPQSASTTLWSFWMSN